MSAGLDPTHECTPAGEAHMVKERQSLSSAAVKSATATLNGVTFLTVDIALRFAAVV